MSIMKGCIYARVSTDEQNPVNQVDPLKAWADTLGIEIIDIYIDVISGGDSNRPHFRQMMADAKKHKFDIILIWSLDRFSREGILNTLSYLKQLNMNKIKIRSLQESWLDTSDDGMGSLMISIFSWVAERERIRLSERTKAGLKNAQNVGKRGKDKKPRKKGGYLLRHSPHLIQSV